MDFPSLLEGWEKFEQNNESIALNILFIPYNSEEITLAYKSEYSFEGKSHLMINDRIKKCYYFAVKSILQLYSSEWLKNKKEAIINGDNCFQNALNDALGCLNIKTDPERISNIEPFVNQYN